MTLETDEKTGLKYRPDTGDKDMLKEMCEYQYLFDNCKDAVVMDVGSNIGTFSLFALKAGAKQIIAYEPEPENFKVLMEQEFAFNQNVTLVNAAIADTSGQMDFYQSKETDKCKGRHSLLKTRGRKVISVPTLAFYDELDKYKPTVLKMDTEGGELLLDWSRLPNYIRYLALEIHCRNNEQNAKGLYDLIKSKYALKYDKQKKFFGALDTYIISGELI
jgi:FkbM family methyltransferase